MKHPNPKVQSSQEDYLSQIPENERAVQAQLFRIGNAAVVYHQLADTVDVQTLGLYYSDWLQELPVTISKNMEELGFEKNRLSLMFMRYVNERNGINMDAWMEEHLSEEDYQVYHKG